jgi:hypothetical protein
MDAAAISAARRALSALGVTVLRGTEAVGPGELEVEAPDGTARHVRIKAAAIPTSGWIANLTTEPDLVLVVADQIPSRARRELSERGIAWLDRRGHLHLVDHGFFIDTDIPADIRGAPVAPAPASAIRGRAGLAAAAALLMQPDRPTGSSNVARLAGLNPSSISRAMAAVADAQLAERVGSGQYRPLTPELFWALADVWPVATVPTGLSVDSLGDPRLGAHLDDPAAIGWAMGGDRAAVAWGAPLVLTGDYPIVLFVPDEEAVRRALALGGGDLERPRHEPPEPLTVELSVDLTGLATTTRYARPGASTPLAHPVFSALELAGMSRGREALDQWDPPERFVRVW